MSEGPEYVDPTEVRPDRVRSLGEIMPGVLRDLRGRLEAENGDLTTWWETLVGPDVAARTRVVGWRAGVLTIGVHSPSQLQECELMLRGPWAERRKRLKPGRPVDKIQWRLLDRRTKND